MTWFVKSSERVSMGTWESLLVVRFWKELSISPKAPLEFWLSLDGVASHKKYKNENAGKYNLFSQWREASSGFMLFSVDLQKGTRSRLTGY